MATMQGITGKLSGKMGSAVFRVRDGQQVVAQYNPIVKNPNSEGQQEQRAKFKLMSQLSAIMERGLGTLSVTNRAARQGRNPRNAFFQINFPLVEVTSEGETVTATIPMEQLKLTSSFRYLPTLIASSTSSNEITVVMSDIPSDVTTLRVVTVGYPGNVAAIVDIRDIPVANGSIGDAYIDVPSEGKYTLLAYGLIPSESAKSSIDLDNIHTPADEDFISAVELNAMVQNGLMAETMTVGTNVEVTEE